MTDDVEFEAEDPPQAGPSARAKAEQEQLEPSHPRKPNSVVIKLWNGGHLNFDPEGSTPIFALVALVIVVASILLLAVAGIWIGQTTWMDTMMSALGHAVTGIIGAIVGSAVSAKKRRK